MTGGSREIKCLVWDLDDTLWDGVLLEGDQVELRDGVRDIMRTLDRRGILHSVASRTDPEAAMRKLRELSLDRYFLYPQIGWGAKAESVQAIATSLNIGADAVAFIDDDPYERDEVAMSVPGVLCIDAASLASLPDMPEMTPRFVTDDSRRRRSMYRAEIERQRVQEVEPPETFLASLGMVLTISEAREGDLERIDELTVRTHQLNSTGYTYSFEELDSFRLSPDHKLLVAGLDPNTCISLEDRDDLNGALDQNWSTQGGCGWQTVAPHRCSNMNRPGC